MPTCPGKSSSKPLCWRALRLLVSVFLLSIIPCVVLLAANDMVLSASDCVKFALENSPVIAIADIDVTMAESLIAEAQASQNPGLRLGASLRYHDQKRTGHMGAAPGATQFYDSQLNEAQLQIRQLIWDAGRSQAKLNASRQMLDVRTSQKHRIEQELLFSVLVSCLDVVNQQAVLEAVKQNIEDVTAALARIRKLEEVGKVANVDVLRVEVREQEIHSHKETAVHMLNSSLARLARICGMENPPQGIASDSIKGMIELPDISPENYMQAALSQRHDIIAQKSKAKAAVYEKKFAVAGNNPVLNAVATGNRYGGNSGKNANNGFAGLELGWQIGDGGLSRARQKNAAANAAKEEHLLRDSELKVSEQVRISASAIDSVLARLTRSQKGLLLAEEAYRIELLNYEHGKGTVNDLLDAQAALFTARSLLIRDQNDLIAARLAMLLALGEPILAEGL